MADFLTLSLNLNGLFSLLRAVVETPILIYTINLPFKRRYHYSFIAYLVVDCSLALSQFWAQTANTPTEYISREFAVYVFAGSGVPVTLLATFILLYLNPRLTKVTKLKLVPVWAWGALWYGLLLFSPNSLYSAPAHSTPAGYITSPGWFTSILPPIGNGIPAALIGILLLVEVFRYYQSHKSRLIASQLKYLALGIALFSYLAPALTPLSRYIGVNIAVPMGALIPVVVALALRKHGFYDVEPAVETVGAPVPIKYPLEQGRSYLARDQRNSFEAFAELTRNGREGLCVTRSPPNEIRNTYGLRLTPIRWLAEEKGEDVIPPTDLLGISLSIKDFLAKARNPVVLLHGVEYLSRLNGAGPVIRLVDRLNDACVRKNAILLLTVLPDALGKEEYAVLAAEIEPLPLPSAT